MIYLERAKMTKNLGKTMGENIVRLKTQDFAKSEGAWIIFVQADQVDQPAVNLYDSMGNREAPFHYDIPID